MGILLKLGYWQKVWTRARDLCLVVGGSSLHIWDKSVFPRTLFLAGPAARAKAARLGTLRGEEGRAQGLAITVGRSGREA